MSTVYRSVGVQVAIIVGNSSAMDAAADSVANKARSLAAGHRVTGDFVRSIGTAKIPGKSGVTDRIAFVDHVAAASIEFGHHQRGTGRFVEGLHIFGRAAGRR